MSMYQVEDLVELSICRLTGSSTDLNELRNDIYSLYRFQDMFDCSFTNLRVLRQLIDCGYTTLHNLEDHPLYPEMREEFEAIRAHDFEYTPGAEGGYWCSTMNDGQGNDVVLGKLCCDYGSALWEEMVAAGKITGDEANPLAPPDFYALVLRVVQQAEACGDIFLMSQWYIYLPILTAMSEDEPFATPEIQAELQKILCKPEVFFMLEDELRPIPDETEWEEEESQVAQWYAPYYEWKKAVAADSSVLFERITELYDQEKYDQVFELVNRGIAFDPTDGALRLFKAYSLIMLQAQHKLPLDENVIRESINFLQEVTAYPEAADEIAYFCFFMAVGHLILGEYLEAEEALKQADLSFEEDEKLISFYQEMEKQWKCI